MWFRNQVPEEAVVCLWICVQVVYPAQRMSWCASAPLGFAGIGILCVPCATSPSEMRALSCSAMLGSAVAALRHQDHCFPADDVVIWPEAVGRCGLVMFWRCLTAVTPWGTAGW